MLDGTHILKHVDYMLYDNVGEGRRHTPGFVLHENVSSPVSTIVNTGVWRHTVAAIHSRIKLPVVRAASNRIQFENITYRVKASVLRSLS